MHLSEQRRCSNAHCRRAAHALKLSYQQFVSYAPVGGGGGGGLLSSPLGGGAVVGAVEGPLSVGWRQAKVGPPLGLAKVMSG